MLEELESLRLAPRSRGEDDVDAEPPDDELDDEDLEDDLDDEPGDDGDEALDDVWVSSSGDVALGDWAGASDTPH